MLYILISHSPKPRRGVGRIETWEHRAEAEQGKAEPPGLSRSQASR